ncbi:MAG TPA: site-2 protease family protein [Prosthecobacter sp.]|nr:site-2 protease family protein [Prosthecobacter sp.]
MKWSYRIATVAGTEVRVHVTFFILLLYIVFQSLHTGQAVSGAFHMVLLICAMFVCVLLHEFGHVFAARGYGIRTPDIILLPIGGLARMERMPRKPSQEFVVAICGPLVNVAIAGGLWLFSGRPPEAEATWFAQPGYFVETLMVWNIAMVLFNLIPAFPMDGGRVLRALLASMMEYGRATRLAARIGQGIALLTVLLLITSDRFNPLFLLIAFFVFMAAGQEAAAVSQEEETRGLRVRDAMLTEFHTLPSDARLQDAVELLLAGSQHDFPVMDGRGGLLGILRRQQLIAGLTKHGPAFPAADLAEACAEPATPGMALSEALQRLHHTSCPALPVFDPLSSALVGLLTAENVGEMLMVRAALRQGRQPLQPPAAS